MMVKDGDSRAPRAIPFNTSQPQVHGREHLSSTWINDPDSYIVRSHRLRAIQSIVCVCVFMNVTECLFIMFLSAIVAFSQMIVSASGSANVLTTIVIKTYRGPNNNHHWEIDLNYVLVKR